MVGHSMGGLIARTMPYVLTAGPNSFKQSANYAQGIRTRAAGPPARRRRSSIFPDTVKCRIFSAREDYVLAVGFAHTCWVFSHTIYIIRLLVGITMR